MNMVILPLVRIYCIYFHLVWEVVAHHCIRWQLGGSTIVLLFKKNKIQFDADILANASQQLETLVRASQHYRHFVMSHPHSLCSYIRCASETRSVLLLAIEMACA
jgi:hypothetical protein